MSEESKPPLPEPYNLPEDLDSRVRWRMRWGVIGVFASMLLFCAGVLIPSSVYRENLGFKSTPVQASKTDEPVKATAEPKSKDAENKPVSGAVKCWNFVVAALIYIPLNIAFLCVLSAFIG